MAANIDFTDPTTWDGELTEADAVTLALWAINTLQHPDGSSDEQFNVLDFFAEGACEKLVGLRAKLEA